MKNILLPTLSRAINTYLTLDPSSKERLEGLEGKIIAIELLPMQLSFQCFFTASGVEIKTDNLLNAEVHIRGTPLQMLGVMLAKNDRQRFFADDVTMNGNVELGMQVIALFDELHIDWEEHLSHVIGDAPAYHLGRLTHGIAKWLRHTDSSLSQSINDYIHEEAAWLPVSEALQDFFADIDHLRMEVDRIEAKIKKVQQAILDKELL